jgi:glutamine amidotransferase
LTELTVNQMSPANQDDFFIAVLDYGIGNLRSAQKAFEFVGGRACLVESPAQARGAGGFVLPGVGAFGHCLKALRESKLDRTVVEAIDASLPFLGICVGLQMLYEGSEETPDVKGLGVIEGAVKQLSGTQKRPQMQWNCISRTDGRRPALLQGVGENPWVYFVHSYAPPLSDVVVATCNYGGDVTAAIERDNLWGTQFHPEKSGAVGLSILANFVALCRSLNFHWHL